MELIDKFQHDTSSIVLSPNGCLYLIIVPYRVRGKNIKEELLG